MSEEYPPTIPDLSALTPSSSTMFMNNMFRGSGPKDHIAYALVMNFVRLTDRAVREFETGRKEIEAFWQPEGDLRLGAAIRAMGHFEGAIDALKRSINHLKQLRASRRVPPSLKALLPRDTALLRGSVEGKITDMRDAVQHLEKDIVNEKIAPGQALVLAPRKYALELGPHSLRYDDLASWIAEAHALARLLRDYFE